MSVRERLEDARVLASTGRREGAFIQVLIAAAATSKKRYKKETWDDGEAFKNFIYDEMGVITGGPKYAVAFPFLGKTTPLEEILYHHLRCQLLHDGEMPDTVVFTERVREGERVQNMLHLGNPLGFPEGWIERLATAVWLAPENDDLWKEEAEERQKSREQLGELRNTSSYCRRPGNQTKEMKSKDERISWVEDGVALRLSYSRTATPLQVVEALEKKAKELRGCFPV